MWYRNTAMPDNVKEIFRRIFPELKENEEEQNIKDLIDELKCSLRAANCQNDACGGGHEKRIALLEWSIAWLEKQGEQKPVEEVEPKFKVGDWVMNKSGATFSNGSISARVQRKEGHKIWLEHGTYVNEWELKKLTD